MIDRGTAGGYSHEINQPLSAVVTGGHACLRRLAKEPPNIEEPQGIGAMDNDTMGLAELDEDIFTFDVQDDALERAAAAASGQAVTIGYCTHWYHCNWPL